MKTRFLALRLILALALLAPAHAAPPTSTLAPVTLSGNQTITGTKNFTGTLQIGGVSISAAYQPLDADLTALAALSGTDVLYYRSAANTWSPITIGAGLTFGGGTLASTGAFNAAAGATATGTGGAAGSGTANGGAGGATNPFDGGAGGTITLNGGNSDDAANGGASGTIDLSGSGIFAGGSLVMNSNGSVNAGTIYTQAGGSLTMGTGNLTGPNDNGTILIDSQIGTTVQGYDPDLATYAGITPSANVQTLIGSANYAAFRSSLGLVIGTNVQAYDADLDDLSDGSLTGSKVGSGIAAGNVTTGTLAVARGGTGLGFYPPLVVVRLAADQTVAFDTTAVIQFAAEDQDAQGWYDTSTYRFTPQAPGAYKVTVIIGLGMLTYTSQEASIFVYKNGSSALTLDRQIAPVDNTPVRAKGTGIVTCNGSSDYLDVRLYNYTSGGVTLSGGTYPISAYVIYEYVHP